MATWNSDVVEAEYLSHPGLVYAESPRSTMELLDGVTRWHARTFLVQGERRISYEQFDRAVDDAAALLVKQGVRPSSRVLILAYNSAEFVLGAWAIWRAGAVAVLGNRWWTSAEIDGAISLTASTLVLTDIPDLQSPQGTRVAPLGSLAAAFDGEVSADAPPHPQVDQDDEALIVFTSGSTGTPKAVVLTHRSVVANQQNILTASHRLPRDVDFATPQRVSLVCTPLFHIGGVSNLITQPIMGGRLVLTEGKFDPKQVLRIIETERVDRWGGVPTMAVRVLEHPDFEKYDLSSLTSFPIGGAPLPPLLLNRLKKKLPQLERRGLANTWGTTESGGFVTAAGSQDLVERPGTVGRPYPVSEVRIADPDGTGVGEVLVRSPTVMTGYLGIDRGTIDEAGWLKTGDLGHLDDDGYLYIDGRSKDIVIRGGENIACRRVETVLLQHPDVSEAAVVGIPHDDLGEEVAALVVPRRGAHLDTPALHEFARARLAYFEVPSTWFFQVSPLPTLPGEKTDKRTIRDRLAAAAHRERPTDQG